MERSKVITHVKLLSLMAKICKCHSAYVLSKLILRLSEEFEIMISTKTVYSLQNFCGLNGEFERSGGSCVDCLGGKGGNVIFRSPSRFSPRNLNHPASKSNIK